MSHSHATPHTPRVDRGIVLAIFAAVAFGASTPFSKQLLHSLDPALTAGLLYLGSGVGLAALLLVRRVRNVTGRCERSNALRPAVLFFVSCSH